MSAVPCWAFSGIGSVYGGNAWHSTEKYHFCGTTIGHRSEMVYQRIRESGTDFPMRRLLSARILQSVQMPQVSCPANRSKLFVEKFNWSQWVCCRCFWPACSIDCKGLTDPQLHGWECGVLCIRSVPQSNDNIVKLRDFFRSEALLTLRCLLLQWRHSDRWDTIMKLESHDKQRTGTRYYKWVIWIPNLNSTIEITSKRNCSFQWSGWTYCLIPRQTLSAAVGRGWTWHGTDDNSETRSRIIASYLWHSRSECIECGFRRWHHRWSTRDQCIVRNCLFVGAFVHAKLLLHIWSETTRSNNDARRSIDTCRRTFGNHVHEYVVGHTDASRTFAHQ